MRYCCVPGCTKFNGHRFPKDPLRQMQWRVAIKRMDTVTKKLWVPGRDDIVCHAHFKPSDYQKTLLGERSILNKTAVPSIFAFRTDTSATAVSREERMKVRREKAMTSIYVEEEVPEIQYETEVTCEESNQVQTKQDNPVPLCESKLIQCELPVPIKFSIENFKYNAKMVNYYTGFKDYDHFMFFFSCLGPCASDLNFKCSLLEPKDQLFLTLIKLRQAKEDIEIAFLFNVSESTVSKLIVVWINFLYFQLKELNIWPSKDTVEQHMPSGFSQKFGSTRVILDATEVPVQKPKDVNAQMITWSSYKHNNTLKTMVGCTPKGAFSYISKSYGGSASDRQIIEKSELLDISLNHFSAGDSIMTDRGIMVQDLFASQGVQVNTPTMLKGKSQLEPEEVVRDRRVSSKRIHVERLIGLSKTFKILERKLPESKLPLGSRIVYICCAISNFRSCIVDKTA